MKLNEMKTNKGAKIKRTRVGRGIGSGKGKTAGRGGKGQTARSGVALNGYEGGQMPLYMRLPKRGFNNIFKKKFSVLNLDKIQKAIDAGKLDVSSEITAAKLYASGLIKKVSDGIRLLAKGVLKSKLTIRVMAASKQALEAVEKAGGKVILDPITPVIEKPKKEKPVSKKKEPAKGKAKAAPKKAAAPKKKAESKAKKDAAPKKRTAKKTAKKEA